MLIFSKTLHCTIRLVSSPPRISYLSSFHCFISVTGAWNDGSWLRCGELPAMGAVFYLGAAWSQWKPLSIPGTHLPLKPGSWLIKKSRLNQVYKSPETLVFKLQRSHAVTVEMIPRTYCTSRRKFVLAGYWLAARTGACFTSKKQTPQ